MEPDNFDLHIYSKTVTYYHKDLMRLIGSVTKKDKSKLENLANEISKKIGVRRPMRLVWGYTMADKYIDNILGHVSFDGLRMSFDLNPHDLKSGYLKYNEHNVGANENIKAALYSVLLEYISILNKRAVKRL